MSLSDCLACRKSALLLRLFDPQEAHLSAEVWSVSDMGEKGFRVTGGAGRHAGPLRHCVVMDVFRQDAASLKQNPDEGSLIHNTGESSLSVTNKTSVILLRNQQKIAVIFVLWCVVVCCAECYLLARRMLTCGLADSGSGTQSGWMRLKSVA